MQQSESLEQKIDKIYVALLGDEFGSKGIVDRLLDVEKEAKLSKSFRQKTMAGLSFLVACGAILAWIGDKIFELLKHK
jgi:hypothetical protein